MTRTLFEKFNVVAANVGTSEKEPFVVSICATASFVRCDTGVLTGASDILSLVVGLQLFSNNFCEMTLKERLAVRELIEYTKWMWTC